MVIPNWNGSDLLATNLPAVLEAARVHPGPVEVVVVDDGSVDASRDVVREHPAVRLVAHDGNRGFGAACATGAGSARHALVLLLNSDARPEPGALLPLCRAFDAPEVFSASPLVREPGGRPAEVTINVPYFRRGRIRYRSRTVAALVSGLADGPRLWHTFFPLGGAVVVDRKRFLELGGFDALFQPFYYEDVDLGFRAWRRGWTCVVVPESCVVHTGGATIGRSFPPRRIRVIRKRNRVLFHCKNLTGTGALSRYLGHQALRAVARLLRLETVELAGLVAALPRLPAALARRRHERAATVRSEPEIVRFIQRSWSANVEAAASARVEEAGCTRPA